VSLDSKNFGSENDIIVHDDDYLIRKCLRI
jgi:hypothetical protein